MNIDVTQAPPQSINVLQTPGTEVVVSKTTEQIEVGNYVPTKQIFISNEQPIGSEFIWIQTGLGKDGSGFTIWFEDGS